MYERLVHKGKKSPPKLETVRKNQSIKTTFRSYFISMLKTGKIDALKELRPKGTITDEITMANTSKYSNKPNLESMDCEIYLKRFGNHFTELSWIKPKKEKLFFKVSVLVWCDWSKIIEGMMMLRTETDKQSDEGKAILWLMEYIEEFNELSSKPDKYEKLKDFYEMLFNKKYTGEFRKKIWGDVWKLILAVNPNLPKKRPIPSECEKILQKLLDNYFGKEKQ